MKLTKFLLTLLIFFLKIINLSCQEDNNVDFNPYGQPIIRVFSNFHAGISEDNNRSAFEIKRAYFGYEYFLSREFTIAAKLDVGSPEDISEFSLLRRYAYFKNAYLKYSNGRISSSFGIIDLLQFKLQEKFWGHRYIFKSFQDEYRFGSSADIGCNIIYEPREYVSLDLSVVNGEGYTQLQADNTYKAAFGISLKNLRGIYARVYFDLMNQAKIQSTLAMFLGYEYKSLIRFGIEYNYKFNEYYESGYNRYGYSLYGQWNILPKFQVFGRYDMVNSNVVENDDRPWNLEKDGSALIGGIQFAPIQQVKLALSYQDWYPYAKNATNEAYLFLNLEYKL